MNADVIIFMTGLMVVALAALVLLVNVSMARNAVKASFTILSVTLSLWIVANTGADTNPINALDWTRLAFAGAALLMAALFIFVIVFPRRLNGARLGILFAIISGVMFAGLSYTDLIVPRIVYKDAYANVVTGDLYWLYVVYILFAVFVSLYYLIRRLKSEVGIDKQRVKYMLIGVAVTSIVALLTNMVIPLLTGANPLAIYGSFATLAFISAIAYSIVRHQMFNIRVATARAAVYILSGVSLALFFGVIIFWLDSLIFRATSMEITQKAFYIFSAVIVGFSFPAIKSFFNQLTKQILLRDMYDPEAVLSSIATIASNTRTSTALLKKVSDELQSKMHLSFVEAYLHKDKDWVQKVSVGKVIAANRIENISEILAVTEGVLVDIGEDEEVGERYEDIGVIVILKTSQNVLGYLTLGYKQNGTDFTPADKNLLEGVANEVAVATENLLRYEAIEQFNETLQEKVQDATSKLRTSNKKLRMLDESKDEFISMASHQLRTPLTSVKGYLSMVLEGDTGEITPEQRKVLEEAYTSSQRMVYLIGDFLNVSRLQTGKFELELSDVQLPTLIADEIGQLKASAKARNITLQYDAPDNFPTLRIDETKIRQVMMNFIDNAIYYAKPDGGMISITLSHHTNHISFRVSDNGIGVPKAEQHQLFSKFYRASNAKKARPDGTGIGLFMAKKVIVAHGGAILFESTEGKGSVFGFRLPIDTKK